MTNQMKNVPELRFPEFDGEWEEGTIKSLVHGNLSDGDWINKEYLLPNGKYRIIQTGNISVGKYLNKEKSSKFISQSSYDELKANEVFPGDILISRLADPAGRSIIMPNINWKMVTSVDVAIIRPNKKFESYFLISILNTDKKLYDISKLVSGTSHKRISRKNLEKVKIIYPKIQEQQKIGDFFSKLDRQIELEEQKLAKLEEQKKGYMQKLFSQEIRFKDNQGNNYPDWKIVEIGDILEERTERSGEGDMLSVTINNGIIKFDEIDRKDNSSKDKSNYRKVYKDDIAYNSMRMWQGASGKSEYEGIVSPAYTVTIPSENINPDFIAYYFKTHKMIHKFKINSQGLTSDTWNLKYRQLKDIKLNLCSKEEQNKIANLLIMYDKLINKQKHKLEILKTNKKGFLQKMFV